MSVGAGTNDGDAEQGLENLNNASNSERNFEQGTDESLVESNSSSGKTAQVYKKKNPLIRGKSVNQEDDLNNSDASQESFNSNDGTVFPSPVAITQEEALRETYSHLARHRYLNSPGSDDINDDCTGSNNQYSVDQSTEGSHLYARSSSRRELEKPPRLQKQLSRDRLPNNKQIQNADANTNGNNSGTQSKDSSTECLDSMGVDVHEFLVKALQSNPRDRSILLKLEHDMVKFVNNKSIDFMRFPDMTSYHRMLVHRVAAYFGMDHNIDAKGKAVIINKTNLTKVPEIKFSDHLVDVDDQCSLREDDMRRRSILKRMKNCQSLEHAHMPVKLHKSWKDSKQRSFEEREVDYEKIRARIFNTQEATLCADKRNRDKNGVVAQWKTRPWNSTDLGSLPGRDVSPPSVSMLGTSSLTSTSNSFSGITVLSRRNHSNGCISSSSSSSSIYRTNNENNFNEDRDQLTPQQPYIGLPYVTIEGQPILYPSKPIGTSSHANEYMQYLPKYAFQPASSHGLPGHSHRQQNNPTVDVQNGMQTNGIPPVQNSHVNNVMYSDQFPYPYQQAPVQLVYYPAPHSQVRNPSCDDVKDELSSEFKSLNIDERQQHTQLCNVISQTSDNQTSFTQSQQNTRQVAVGNTLQDSLEKPSNNPKIISSNTNEALDKPILNENERSNVTGSNDNPSIIADQLTETVASAIHTVPGGCVAYYTSSDAAVSLQPGVTGQPVIAAPGMQHHPHIYTGNMMPYTAGNIVTGRKILQQNQHHEYYVQGYNNYVQGPTQPMYYMMNNHSGVQTFQNRSNQVFTNVPVVYTALSNGYPQSTNQLNYDQQHQQIDQQHQQIDQHHFNNQHDVSNQDIHPMLVDHVASGIASSELNKFAAKYNARIMQVSEDEDPQMQSIYLLFSSSKLAYEASHELQSASQPVPFRMIDVTDVNQRTEILDQIKSAK